MKRSESAHGARLVATVALAGTIAVGGCSTAPSPAETDSPAEVIAGIGVQLEHSQYFVTYTRPIGLDAARFRARLLDYVRLVDPAAPFDLVEPLGPPLRARDFWALVLANETGQELAIHAYESAPERDRSIDEFLLALSRSDTVARALRKAVDGSELDLSAFSDGNIFAGAMMPLGEPDALGSRSPGRTLRIRWRSDARIEVVASPRSAHELCRIILFELLFPVTHVELRLGLLTPEVFREAWRVSASPCDEQASRLEAALWEGNRDSFVAAVLLLMQRSRKLAVPSPLPAGRVERGGIVFLNDLDGLGARINPDGTIAGVVFDE